MKLVPEIKVKIGYNSNDVLLAIRKKCNIFAEEILKWEIVKESIDARKKPDVFVKLNVAVEVKKQALKKVQKLNDIFPNHSGFVEEKIEYNGNSPIIVGFGPAGMFAGLYLAKKGLKPIILEQGKSVYERQKDVDEFWNNRVLNEKSNVQFGEGGAGTFSDGKLASNVSNDYTKKVINEFVLHGAPEDISYSYAPHIGSDKLKEVVVNIRKKIESLGGKVLFNTEFVDYETKNGRISAVNAINLQSGEKFRIETSALILAVGHSASNVYKLLKNKGVELKQKPFAIGVRIEQSQEMINASQYGEENKDFPASNYKLAVHLDSGRSVFTFCNCPGGVVVASSADKESIVTNGMSYRARDGKNANAALLVNVCPEDYDNGDVLDGIAFQQKYEKLAFELGGKNYNAPIEKVKDFLAGKEGGFDENMSSVQATYKPNVTFADLSKCLPDFAVSSLKEALPLLDKKVKGFADDENLLIGVETRSSAPVQILRDENLTNGIVGLYSAGEGAGFAGGITSSGADGVKIAEKVVEFLTLKEN
ncbi:MAG: hypothetical protein IKJ33_05515 [Clostridia bacterium]|nr:hypothetical protein [Clostridia bacterium]